MAKQKKFKSIRFKLFFRVVLIFLFAVVLFWSLSRFGLPKLYEASAKRTMLSVADAMEDMTLDSPAFLRELATIEKENGVSVDMYRKDGAQIYFGKTDFAGASGMFTIKNREALADGSSFEIRTFSKDNSVFLVYDRQLQNDNSIEIYSKMSKIDEDAQTAIHVTTITSLATLLFSIFFIYFYSKRFTQPLIEMRDVTKGIADMDFSRKCQSGDADEIGELSASINSLSDSLKDTLEDLNQKNEKLLEDIEKEHALEKMRKDFIASVSHELKTPISIISGYAEGAKLLLENGQTEKAEEYCTIIGAESERMNKLVLELLELSKYEAGAMPLAKENFDLAVMVQDYVSTVSLPFAEKGIHITTDLLPSAPAFADSSKMRMVLNNFIQNAASHAAGEKEIVVSLEDFDAQFYKLSVFNTGNPIAAEDLEKVWKSFYRADKAHSRKEGRFGLGLSIVEEIEKLHKAPYGVENKETGVLFWATCPKAK